MFKADGTVTAGNSSGMNDGAAALVLMSSDRAKALGVQPLGRFLGHACAGVLPEEMGLGPVPATKKLLARTRMKLSDFRVIELNEAFAAQVLACFADTPSSPDAEITSTSMARGSRSATPLGRLVGSWRSRPSTNSVVSAAEQRS